MIKTHNCSLVSDHDRGSLIVSLLNSAGPPAIFRTIAFVVINTVKSLPRFWKPHVGKKVFKLLPPITHSDSPAAVVFPLKHVWILASPFHCRPDAINFLRLSIFCHAVRGTSFRSLFFCVTTATGYFASAKIVKCLNSFFSAGALAQPVTMLAISFLQRGSGKPAKFLPCNICWRSHEF